MRRLLPYERALIDTLGITEEEYFRFIAYQEQYKDIKDGTILDIRNGLEAGTVALILSIVGTLASVGAALLAPRPQAPELDAQAGGSRRGRRFSPRFGFDSVQDLAQYGSPLNLVYTDVGTNPTGGVRVASSLSGTGDAEGRCEALDCPSVGIEIKTFALTLSPASSGTICGLPGQSLIAPVPSLSITRWHAPLSTFRLS